MQSRRSLLQTLLSTCLVAVPFRVFAAQPHHCPDSPKIDILVDETGKQLGDTGFMHKKLHCYYPTYFPSVKCPCKQGECRPTKWRRHPNEVSTIQVWIDRNWISTTTNTNLRMKKDLPATFPAALLAYSAHACAYGSHPNMTVTCVWIMDADV